MRSDERESLIFFLALDSLLFTFFVLLRWLSIEFEGQNWPCLEQLLIRLNNVVHFVQFYQICLGRDLHIFVKFLIVLGGISVFLNMVVHSPKNFDRRMSCLHRELVDFAAREVTDWLRRTYGVSGQ